MWAPYQQHLHPLELVRNADSWPSPSPPESEIWEWGPAVCFNKPSRWFWCVWRFENRWFSALNCLSPTVSQGAKLEAKKGKYFSLAPHYNKVYYFGPRGFYSISVYVGSPCRMRLRFLKMGTLTTSSWDNVLLLSSEPRHLAQDLAWGRCSVRARRKLWGLLRPTERSRCISRDVFSLNCVVLTILFEINIL